MLISIFDTQFSGGAFQFIKQNPRVGKDGKSFIL